MIRARWEACSTSRWRSSKRAGDAGSADSARNVGKGGSNREETSQDLLCNCRAAEAVLEHRTAVQGAGGGSGHIPARPLEVETREAGYAAPSTSSLHRSAHPGMFHDVSRDTVGGRCVFHHSRQMNWFVGGLTLVPINTGPRLSLKK